MVGSPLAGQIVLLKKTCNLSRFFLIFLKAVHSGASRQRNTIRGQPVKLMIRKESHENLLR